MANLDLNFYFLQITSYPKILHNVLKSNKLSKLSQCFNCLITAQSKKIRLPYTTLYKSCKIEYKVLIRADRI